MVPVTFMCHLYGYPEIRINEYMRIDKIRDLVYDSNTFEQCMPDCDD